MSIKIIRFFIWINLAFTTNTSIAFTQNNENTISQGRVIFVTGSCSSGKSSMAKNIAQTLNAKSFTFDEYAMPLILKKFIQKHYGNFLAFFINGFVMRNFFTTVNFLSEKKKYELQKKFYNDLKSGMAIQPTLKMFREVKHLALQGENVVVEAPLYLWGGVDLLSCLSVFKETNITYVLAYCPWSCLVDRIKQRNSSKNKKVHRELDWALINFVPNFEVTSEYRNNNFLELINGKDVHKTITEYSKSEYKKQRMCIFTETRQSVLQAFPDDKNYYVYPRFNYDVIVNTKDNSPEQGAKIVLDYIHKGQ